MADAPVAHDASELGFGGADLMALRQSRILALQMADGPVQSHSFPSSSFRTEP
jgi:hypothetical protein